MLDRNVQESFLVPGDNELWDKDGLEEVLCQVSRCDKKGFFDPQTVVSQQEQLIIISILPLFISIKT